MSKKKIWILIIILLFLAALAAAYYYFYYLPGQESEPGGTPAGDEGPQPIAYDGQFVSGEVPQGWTVVEYSNGAGSDMLVSGVAYVGLTGLEVKNPGGTVVFSLKGVYGIGGLETCANYYQFADHSAAYLAQIQADNAEIGDPAPAIVDLTAASYQEYELFGIPVRRIGTAFYWDTVGGDAFFQAACGIRERFINFASPTFTGDGMAVDSYQFTLNSASPEADLLEMDAILESLTTP